MDTNRFATIYKSRQDEKINQAAVILATYGRWRKCRCLEDRKLHGDPSIICLFCKTKNWLEKNITPDAKEVINQWK